MSLHLSTLYTVDTLQSTISTCHLVHDTHCWRQIWGYNWNTSVSDGTDETRSSWRTQRTRDVTSDIDCRQVKQIKDKKMHHLTTSWLSLSIAHYTSQLILCVHVLNITPPTHKPYGHKTFLRVISMASIYGSIQCTQIVFFSIASETPFIYRRHSRHNAGKTQHSNVSWKLVNKKRKKKKKKGIILCTPKCSADFWHSRSTRVAAAVSPFFFELPQTFELLRPFQDAFLFFFLSSLILEVETFTDTLLHV